MKCKSCNGDVPPKFTHAITMNMCPLCGQSIMEEDLQESLVLLKEAMSGAEKYPQEVFDWLKSNYNLYSASDMEAAIKESEVKAVDLYKASVVGTPMQHKVANKEAAQNIQVDEDGNQITGVPLQSSEHTTKFFKNAQATKVLDRQQHFKNIVKQIKKESSGSSDIGMVGAAGGMITPEMLGMSEGALDSEGLEELKMILGTEDSGAQSALDSGDYEDDIPLVVQQMANQAGGNIGMNAKDVARLQNIQGKSARASSAMARNGGVGLIRR